MKEADRHSMLTEVTRLRFLADQGRLAQILSKEAALRKNLQDLDIQGRRLRGQLENGDDPATIAGADLRWRIWADQRRKAINHALARVLAEKQECLAAVRSSFGRQQAAVRLDKRARNALRLQQLRRAAYVS